MSTLNKSLQKWTYSIYFPLFVINFLFFFFLLFCSWLSMTTDMKAVWIFSVSVCLFVCLAFDLLCDNVSNDLVIWLRGDLSIVVVIIKNKKIK